MEPYTTRLKLGGFEFLDFEVPESIAISGEQKTVVHRLVGGARVIDLTGVDYDDITWSGIFTGSTAGARARALEQMRDAGKVVTLTFDDYSFDVVIGKVSVQYDFIYKRPYTIHLVVEKRNDAPTPAGGLPGLDELVNGDVGQLLGLSSVVSVPAVTSAISNVQSAVSSVQYLASATVDTVQTIVRPIVSAQQVVQQTIRSLESSVNDITSLGGLVPGNPVSKAVDNLFRQADAATRIPALYQMQSVLGRVQKNVSAGPTAGGIKTITTTSGNLINIASDVYGDATQWLGLAKANNLTDPKLTGIQTIVVPTNPS